jgi:SAM-dependent methyltransferase
VGDVGSGSGRIVNMLLDAGALEVTAVEPSDAFVVLKENTAERQTRVRYVHGPGEALPAAPPLDLVVSIGVLHHVPDPAPVARAMCAALKPGGRGLVWLYGREGNGAYLAFALPLRAITTRLPDRALWGLSAALSALLQVYIGACRFLPLPMRNYMRNVVGKWTPEVRKLTIYDQLNPAYAKYYTRAEGIALLTDAGFGNVTAYHRHGYSWTVSGVKPGSAA